MANQSTHVVSFVWLVAIALFTNIPLCILHGGCLESQRYFEGVCFDGMVDRVHFQLLVLSYMSWYVLHIALTKV